jgi:hypothetical protein
MLAGNAEFGARVWTVEKEQIVDLASHFLKEQLQNNSNTHPAQEKQKNNTNKLQTS